MPCHRSAQTLSAVCWKYQYSGNIISAAAAPREVHLPISTHLSDDLMNDCHRSAQTLGSACWKCRNSGNIICAAPAPRKVCVPINTDLRLGAWPAPSGWTRPHFDDDLTSSSWSALHTLGTHASTCQQVDYIVVQHQHHAMQLVMRAQQQDKQWPTRGLPGPVACQQGFQPALPCY
jgi:hypothetical protein